MEQGRHTRPFTRMPTHTFSLFGLCLATNGVPVRSLMLEKVKAALGDWWEEELNQFSWDFG